MFVLGTAHRPALAQYPGGGGYPGGGSGGGSGGSSGGYPGSATDAGYYGLATYSGGTVTVVNGGTATAPNGGSPSFAPIDAENYSGIGNASAGTDRTTGAAQNCSVDVKGPLTAKFHWVPADSSDTSTPSSTIVVQTATASFETTVGGGATASGSIDTGTGNPMPPPTSLYSQSWTDSKYSVEGGGSDVSVSMTPLASFGGGTIAGRFDSYLYGKATITYKAHVYVPFIKITGVNAANQALTGQQITAHLNTNQSPITITSYTWSFTSGTPIKNWDGNGVAADGTPQQLFLLTNTDLTGTDTSINHTGITAADLSFYDQVAESVTVKCTVKFKFPDGTTGTISPEALPVKFLKPTATWIASGTDPFGPRFDQTMMGFAEGWSASITVPPQFSGGSGCFAQTVTPTVQFQRHPTGNQFINCYLKEPHRNTDGTTTYGLPTPGLDTQFPYPFDLTSHYSDGYIWDVSVTGQSGDLPSIHLDIPASDNGGNNWYTAFDSDNFTTWLMYRPSSGGTGPFIWVPLQRVDWTWAGNVVKSSTTGVWSSANSGAAVTGSSPDHGVTTNSPPQWNTVNVGAVTLQP